ncbi:disease resistance protein SUMM2-like [Humulus lupulus]|uniref:disease resistance protein SUMM2-like n=1 Tax=Humulus lupulus TaxID=3486 RepID=UPI002B40DD12|nr:disease resistance protein SUMM2-like [Humulus lupulus]
MSLPPNPNPDYLTAVELENMQLRSHLAKANRQIKDFLAQLPLLATDVNVEKRQISSCFELTAREAKYVCELEENLEALKKALDHLKNKNNDVLRRVIVAEEEPHMKRLDEAQRWISLVEAMETKVDELMLTSSEEINRLCLCGCCSKNYRSSYKFGKIVHGMLAQVIDLQSKRAFELVAEREPVALVVELPAEPSVGSKLQLEEVWRDINDENVSIMGLYRMGGVGETTLLKSINSKKNYNVIWVVMSKDHTIEKVQNDIGDKIGCSGVTWKNKTCQQKYEDILKMLSKKKFVLVLDDIWKRINLVKFGIPLPSRQNGSNSKLVFTTCSKGVCCRMTPEKQVEVKCLSWEKSLKLFEEKVGKEALNVHP